MKIFLDRNLKTGLQGNVLLEGFTYFLDFSDLTPAERLQLVTQSQLERFSTHTVKTMVLPLTINGFVGTISLGANTYDVRSRKLGDGVDGDTQFKTILQEIEAIIGGLNFQYNSPVVTEAIESKGTQPSDEERLFFLKRLFGPDNRGELPQLIDLILRVPKTRLVPVQASRRVGLSGKADVRRLRKNLHRFGLEKRQVESEGQGFGIATAAGTFIVRTLPRKANEVSVDTLENRFVKFFLQDVEGLCLRVIERSVESAAVADAKLLLSLVRVYLQSEFFKSISRQTVFPSHSPSLTGSFAYAAVYKLFLRSRLEATHLLNEMQRQARSSPLKDIATLYEIWAFMQVVDCATRRSKDIQLFSFRRDLFGRNTCWSTDKLRIFYNRQFSARKDSYSLAMRPDITIETGDTERSTKRWYMDAKYKLSRFTDDSEDTSPVSADIHKMHTYVDAIDGSVASVVLYPGDSEQFFSRDKTAGNSLKNVVDLGGVAAMPLKPSTDKRRLSQFLAAIENRSFD